MLSLSRLGLNINWTYETIITCYNGNMPHAAPFGIKSPDMKTIQLEIYKGSSTLNFILDKRDFVINFVDDTTHLFNSLYEKNKLGFTEAEKVKAPVIAECPSFIEARMAGSSEKTESYTIDTEIINININYLPNLINRAEGLVIESLITATRLNYMPEGKAEKILKENCRVIKKVAPGSQHVDIMEKLLNKCAILK